MVAQRDETIFLRPKSLERYPKKIVQLLSRECPADDNKIAWFIATLKDAPYAASRTLDKTPSQPQHIEKYSRRELFIVRRCFPFSSTFGCLRKERKIFFEDHQQVAHLWIYSSFDSLALQLKFYAHLSNLMGDVFSLNLLAKS